MTEKTQKLIEEIKEYYNVSDLSELNEKQWKEISGTFHGTWNNRLTEEFIDTYSDKLNWYYICEYQQLSEKFIEKHSEKVRWKQIGEYQKLSENFIERHSDKFDWWFISKCQKLSEPFIEKHAGKIDWCNISEYQKLNENFIEKHKDKVDWYKISIHQNLSENFIDKYADRLDWELISPEQNMSLKFIKKHSNRIDYSRLFLNKHINLSEKINNIDKYPEWTDIILTVYKTDTYNELSVSEIKRKFQAQKFWKSYINYLKSEYPDKNILQIKIFDKIIEISDIFNMDRSRLLDIINKSIKRNSKTPETKKIDF